mmetsp:Transcript_23534/g.79794  ORF Transcript_23534/g.79794 Transcript_23534/m.79794 type:complete len:206 (-) Transcript_23534:580-1197(-)
MLADLKCLQPTGCHGPCQSSTVNCSAPNRELKPNVVANLLHPARAIVRAIAAQRGFQISDPSSAAVRCGSLPAMWLPIAQGRSAMNGRPHNCDWQGHEAAWTLQGSAHLAGAACKQTPVPKEHGSCAAIENLVVTVAPITQSPSRPVHLVASSQPCCPLESCCDRQSGRNSRRDHSKSRSPNASCSRFVASPKAARSLPRSASRS